MRRTHSAPRGLTAIGVVAMVVVALPVVALLTRVPWGSFGEVVTDSATRTALWLSLRTSLITVVLSWIAGMPVAWLFAHAKFPGKTVVRAI